MNIQTLKISLLTSLIFISASCGDDDEMVVSTPTDTFSASVSISPASSTITEDAGEIELIISLGSSNTSENAQSIDYNVSGTASSGDDYSGLSENVTIPVGASAATLSFAIVEDEEVEEEETIIITLDLAGSSELSAGTTVEAIITIVDNDIEEEPMEPGPVPSNQPNILFIIADDMGLDATNGYAEGVVKPTTPHLDEIMNQGLKFTNLWVNPTCSPTRAAILTGKYGISTGVTAAGDALDQSETILHSYINQNASEEYATALIGKWHLSNNKNFNPEVFGMDYYAGMISGTAEDYYNWAFTEDGNSTTETSYITEKFTDLSIDWVAAQDKPWFLWLAYNAPHTPFHAPPAEMHSQGSLATDQSSIDDDPLSYYLAAIEAMDYQIGRLLDSMSQEELDNTIIIFIGDNGTPGSVAQSPYERGKTKGSVYQGGLNTPMFIAGPVVSRTGTEDALINGTDLFATIASLAGANIAGIHDSKDFSSLLQGSNPGFRDYLYSEAIDGMQGTNQWAARNMTYKLIENSDGNQELYNLIDDPYEVDDLLSGALSVNEEAAKVSLEAEISRIRG